MQPRACLRAHLGRPILTAGQLCRKSHCNGHASYRRSRVSRHAHGVSLRAVADSPGKVLIPLLLCCCTGLPYLTHTTILVMPVSLHQ